MDSLCNTIYIDFLCVKEYGADMRKVLFIYNPKAGKAGIVSCLSDVVTTISNNDFEITIYPTKCHGDGVKKTREDCKGYDRIICSGGDGTLDEVVTGVMEAGVNIPIGYIPAGSTNDYGRSINIPKDMRQAAVVASGDNLFRSDIGKFNDRYFVYVAAFGMFTDVTYETDQNLKNVLGYAAYLAEGIKRLQTVKAIPLKITYDDEVLADNFLVGVISNSNSIGGMKALPGPDVDLTDGKFEVLLVKAPESVLDLNAIALAILDRRIKSEHVITFKCSEISIVSDEPIPWTLDGEFGGSVSNVAIKNLHEAVEFVVP